MKQMMRYTMFLCLLLLVGGKVLYDNSFSLKINIAKDFKRNIELIKPESKHSISENIVLTTDYLIEIETLDTEEEEEDERFSSQSFFQQTFYNQIYALLFYENKCLENNNKAYNSTPPILTSSCWYISFSRYIGFI